ncbi:hypothetical protein E2C01_024682 [Portunus trituberculatus]|uniref:Uncharacterized protein n=1 Tax=Portunus trituberculatus TaxID=210409 RepID=A0A5B7EFH2_PORTR|nr:hypothetical protein [Portunus trituberculatus]
MGFSHLSLSPLPTPFIHAPAMADPKRMQNPDCYLHPNWEENLRPFPVSLPFPFPSLIGSSIIHVLFSAPPSTLPLPGPRDGRRLKDVIDCYTCYRRHLEERGCLGPRRRRVVRDWGACGGG